MKLEVKNLAGEAAGDIELSRCRVRQGSPRRHPAPRRDVAAREASRHGPQGPQASRHQAGQARGVAKDHAAAGGGGLAHAVGVEVQRHVGDGLFGQQAGQVLPAAAIAADDDVGLVVNGLLGDGGELQRLQHPLVAVQPHHDAVAVHDDEGRGQHRQHHAGKHRALPAAAGNNRSLAAPRVNNTKPNSPACAR